MKKIADYTLMEEIGSGSQGYVYRALRNGREYACKVSEDERTLEREGKILKTIMSRRLNIPEYSEYFKTDKGYLFMEYIKGVSLDKYMMLLRKNVNNNSRYEREEYHKMIYDIIKGVAKILKNIHDLKQPLIYMDLKTENILIKNNNKPYLIDFGSALYLNEGRSVITGTRGYGAREQFVKGGKVGLYTDVYAFGRLAHYMLTGDSPYLPPYEKPPIREYDSMLSKELSNLLAACTVEDTSLRPPDMGYVCDRLEKITPVSKGLGQIFARSHYEGEFVYIKNVVLR
ncbi:MAG: protein kinase [Lachnospiraceae bacterium]|nr:protein kinase [Lachnospiraceae bacterium]